jgi:predicted dehydrogenase
MLGPLTDVAGAAANLAGLSDVEDAVAMTFRTPSGALGVAQWNYASAVSEDLIQITGTKARLLLSTFGNEPLRLIDADGREESFNLPNPPHIQQPLIQSIVDELHGRGRCPSTGDSAARTAAVMDQVLTAYYAGRDDPFWTRPQTWPGRPRAVQHPSPHESP